MSEETRTMSINLDVNGYEVPNCHLEYNIYGKHYPETPTSPEEWPEIELERLYIDGIENNSVLDTAGIYEDLQEQVLFKLAEES